MADAIFDGTNLHITLPSIGSFDTQKEIYSAWKEWIRQGDNAKYPPAFDTIGGDPTDGDQVVAPYFFCRNELGWRIKMPLADGEIIVSGNLFPRDPTTSLFEQTSGYDAFLRLQVSTKAVVVSTGSGVPSDLQAKIEELWQIRGLDQNNPVTVTESAEQSGTIDIVISGDGETTSTATRQP